MPVSPLPLTPSTSLHHTNPNQDGTRTAYFRGRKLAGKAVKLPEGYRGVVVEKQPPKSDLPGQDDDGEEQLPLGSLETKAEFEEVVVWGHETTTDGGSDPYARVDEWIGLAETIHSYPGVEKGA